MKRKTLLALSAIPLTLLLSSCFVLQGFWVVANSVAAGGQGTKVVFRIRPSSAEPGDSGYQFFLVGVNDVNELKVGKAKWGTNRKFGGPYALRVEPGLAAAVDAAGTCVSNGFAFSDVNNVTWKGFATPNSVNDRNQVNKDVVVEAGVKALASAQVYEHPIIGVTGLWIDENTNGTPDAGDTFWCTGVGQVNLNVT